MSRFSSGSCIAHSGVEAQEFVLDVLAAAESVLFIGTVGLETASHYFPSLLRSSGKVDFRFVVERRPTVQQALLELGGRHRKHLQELLAPSDVQFVEVDVVAPDGATVAGRNAVAAASQWLRPGYTHIVVDATGMSRGICFPIAKQAMLFAAQAGANMHLLVAGNKKRALQIESETNDRADWMHGFQGAMGTDRAGDMLKLWVPQLAEGMGTALGIMGGEIPDVAEVCPIVPFPSHDPRRGDKLLSEHGRAVRDQWESGSLDLIYAHETNPMDVFRTVSRLHRTRQKVFEGGTRKTTTILSPSGWRIGSVGMLLAAIEHELPMLYVETVGYSCKSDIPDSIEGPEPDVSWHLWLAGEPYRDASAT